jgi:lipopolysaccharide exporter
LPKAVREKQNMEPIYLTSLTHVTVTAWPLLFQPLRAVMVVVAALVWRSPLACALAYTLAMLIHLPLIYWVKGRFQPNDWKELRHQLLRNALVGALALAVPLGIALWQGLQRSSPMPLGWFLGSIASCIASWLLALVLLRHPLSLDPVFQRVLRRLRLGRQHNADS